MAVSIIGPNIGFIFFILLFVVGIGVGIYYFINRNKNIEGTLSHCKDCDKDYDAGRNFCEDCGNKLSNKTIKSNNGGFLERNSKNIKMTAGIMGALLIVLLLVGTWSSTFSRGQTGDITGDFAATTEGENCRKVNESYTESVPYEVQVPYTVEVPYTYRFDYSVVNAKQSTDYSFQLGEYTVLKVEIWNKEEKWGNFEVEGKFYVNDVLRKSETKDKDIGANMTAEFKFIFDNDADEDVISKYSSVGETETRYRTETRHRTETRYRDETRYRMIEKCE